MVGEPDQAAMQASIVPAQIAGRPKRAKPEIEDRIDLFVQSVFGVVLVGLGPERGFEKAGGRQLHRIADDDALLRARDRAKGVFRAHLRRLVDDDQVEQLRNLGQILRHRDRRHHEAGLELAGGGPRPKKQVAERQRASLQGNLILNEGALGEIARPADPDARLDSMEI